MSSGCGVNLLMFSEWSRRRDDQLPQRGEAPRILSTEVY